MHFTRSSAAAVLAATLPMAMAQTFTSCNPLTATCPADPGMDASDFSVDFTQGESASFSTAAYSHVNYGSNGAEFSISQDKQAPTISTDFYFLFGRVDVKMRAAPGQGIISSIVLESDDLDEIDWEFTGGDTTQVQSNFFGKGNTTTYNRVEYISVGTPQDTFHTYSVDWNADRLQWIIDGVVVRTLEYTNPLTNGGTNYPQTPMRLKLGNWCGGCAGEPEGTVEWAGGATNFDGAPYVMYVESVSIHNNNPAKTYVYGDHSGTWQSIKINGGSGSGSVSGTAMQSATSSAIPTSMLSVAPVNNTAVAATTTVLAPPHSTNSASVAAQNTGTFATVSTGVPSQTTASASSSQSSSSPSSTVIPHTGAASSLQSAMTGASLLGLAFAFFML